MVQQQIQFNRMLSAPLRCMNEGYRQRNCSFALMLLIIAALGISSIFWGEKIPVNGGFGWDGQIYGAVAQHMNVHDLDTYYFHRILPSAIVHYALTILRQPLDNQHVILAFGFLNLTMLLLSCTLYRLIASQLALDPAGFWLGFAAIFVNFMCFKVFWYYPVQTDTTAVALSLAMLAFYLREQRVLVFAAALLGAFTFPTLIYAGIFLLAFPLEAIVERKTSVSKWVGAGFATAICAGVVYLYYVRHESVGDTLAQPIRVAIPLSLVLCAMYAYKACEGLLSGITCRAFLRSLSVGGVSMAAILIIAVAVSGHLVADRTPSQITMHSTIRDILMRSVVKPLAFLVSHPMYFGPAFLLLVLCWRPFTRTIRRYGIGLVLVVLMGVVTSLTPESRQSTPSYVIAAPFLGLLVDKLVQPGRFFGFFGALAFGSTKVWMHMGLSAYDDRQYLRFPLQNFFMNLGPWMNNRMYVLQGVAVLIASVLLHACVKSTVNEDAKGEGLPSNTKR